MTLAASIAAKRPTSVMVGPPTSNHNRRRPMLCIRPQNPLANSFTPQIRALDDEVDVAAVPLERGGEAEGANRPPIYQGF